MDEENKNSELNLTIDKRKRKVKDFLFNKQTLLVVVGLIVLIWMAWSIRTANVPALKDITTNDYTLGPDLDPFLFLRYAKNIVENGKLMEHDSMRYVPLGWDTIRETKILPYMIAYFHLMLSKFKDVSINYSAVIFPAFMFLLTVVAFFLFIRKLFENKKSKNVIALIASAFLIVSPSLLPRTIAGIPEKESVSFLFIFLAFYFFLSAWKSQKSLISDDSQNLKTSEFSLNSESYQESKILEVLKSEKIRNGIIFAALAGISTAITGLIWGGVRYIYLAIALTILLSFIFGKVKRRHVLFYSIWIVLSFGLTTLATEKVSLIGMMTSGSTSGFAFFVFCLLLVDFLIFNTRIKDLSIIKKMREKVPDRIVSVIFLIIFALIFSTLFLGFGFIHIFFDDLIFSLTRPYQDRLSFTVAENKQPYFNEWMGNFPPVFKNIPVFLWLFFIGSIFLFYDAVKNIGKRKWILTSSYVLFLFGLVFSRYSSSSLMNGTNLQSKIVYFGSFLIIFLGFAYLYYKHYKEGSLDILKKANMSYFLLLSFFFVGLIGARNAIRLLMVLAIPASAIIGYFSVVIVEKAREKKGEIMKFVVLAVAFIVVISTLYSFYLNYQITLSQARSMAPSAYTQQWQTAMRWVRENTNENAVFAHWWDYGYWVQSIGNRATILDGGNAIDYWDYLLGRHVLTGQTEKEALEFLYTHNATHLLIDSSEIGKYGAYASIGSDENYDRYSQISTFTEDESQMREGKEDILHLYRGGMFLDEDYSIKENNNTEFLPAYKTGIGGVFLIQGNNGTLKQPEVIFVYEGKQINMPLRCVYFEGKKYDFETGYNGCLYLIPRLVNEEGRMFIKNTGVGLFITERSMRALWIKLYFFGEGENFKLVHTEDNFIVRDLKNQGSKIGDFVFYQGVQGPIKIWEVSYPSDIEFKPEYLETSYPNVNLRIATNFM